MDEYLIPGGYGEYEFTEKRSRFIGRVWPVSSEQEALERIAQTRALEEDASHNVYAYSVRGGPMRFSDDGEPGGTGGNPVMNVFTKPGIDGFCCVVTRYFGGILLGAGGLVRAYSKAAAGALNAAGTGRVRPWNVYAVTCSYGAYERLRRDVIAFGAAVENVEYAESVTMTVAVPEAESAGIETYVADRTGAAASVLLIDTQMRA